MVSVCPSAARMRTLVPFIVMTPTCFGTLGSPGRCRWLGSDPIRFSPWFRKCRPATVSQPLSAFQRRLAIGAKLGERRRVVLLRRDAVAEQSDDQRRCVGSRTFMMSSLDSLVGLRVAWPVRRFYLDVKLSQRPRRASSSVTSAPAQAASNSAFALAASAVFPAARAPSTSRRATVGSCGSCSRSAR